MGFVASLLFSFLVSPLFSFFRSCLVMWRCTSSWCSPFMPYAHGDRSVILFRMWSQWGTFVQSYCIYSSTWLQDPFFKVRMTDIDNQNVAFAMQRSPRSTPIRSEFKLFVDSIRQKIIGYQRCFCRNWTALSRRHLIPTLDNAVFVRFCRFTTVSIGLPRSL